MGEIRSYRDLEVWQLAMQFVKENYLLTQSLPPEERYGLTSQVRRSSGSVPANIAEGYGRDNAGDYARFLQIAQGSLKETETLLLLCNDLSFVSQEQITPSMHLADRIGRMLRSLIRAIQSRKQTGSPS